MACGIFRRTTHAAACALVLTSCGLPDLQNDDPPTAAGDVQITFEDVAIPGVFDVEGTAVRSDDGSRAGGLWGVVGGLRRPERALVVNEANGKRVTVALFEATRSMQGHAILLSALAADELGVNDLPIPVRITAVRSEPKLVSP